MSFWMANASASPCGCVGLLTEPVGRRIPPLDGVSQIERFHVLSRQLALWLRFSLSQGISHCKLYIAFSDSRLARLCGKRR